MYRRGFYFNFIGLGVVCVHFISILCSSHHPTRTPFQAEQTALTVCVRVRQSAAGHAVEQPCTYSKVFGVQPHGIESCEFTRHVGTGHRIAEQPAGCVVRVMVGQMAAGGGVVFGGSVTMLVVTTVLLVLVDVDVVVLVLVLRVGRPGRRRLDVEDVDVEVGSTGQGWFSVANSAWQPAYGQSTPHGAMRVAVGTFAGHPHGFWIVEKNVQSEEPHLLVH